MKQLIVDFSGIKNCIEMHEVLKNALDFPAFYGMNLDALWDLLTGYIETPVCIHLIGYKDLPTQLNWSIEIFSDYFPIKFTTSIPLLFA